MNENFSVAGRGLLSNRQRHLRDRLFLVPVAVIAVRTANPWVACQRTGALVVTLTCIGRGYRQRAILTTAHNRPADSRPGRRTRRGAFAPG